MRQARAPGRRGKDVVRKGLRKGRAGGAERVRATGLRPQAPCRAVLLCATL